LRDLGLVLAFLLREGLQADISIFGTRFSRIEPINRLALDNIIEGRRLQNSVGLATNGHLVIEYAIDRAKNGKFYDHIMLFTDCQLWDTDDYDPHCESRMQKEWRKYKAIHPEAKLWIFNLAGYGTSPIKLTSNGAHLISGWSDMMFKLLEQLKVKDTFIEWIYSMRV
jgi:hypothetical protein